MGPDAPIRKGPYTHPNDYNMQIYPEPRHYAMSTGAYGQIKILGFGNEPTNTSVLNAVKYAFGGLG